MTSNSEGGQVRKGPSSSRYRSDSYRSATWPGDKKSNHVMQYIGRSNPMDAGRRTQDTGWQPTNLCRSGASVAYSLYRAADAPHGEHPQGGHTRTPGHHAAPPAFADVAVADAPPAVAASSASVAVSSIPPTTSVTSAAVVAAAPCLPMCCEQKKAHSAFTPAPQHTPDISSKTSVN